MASNRADCLSLKFSWLVSTRTWYRSTHVTLLLELAVFATANLVDGLSRVLHHVKRSWTILFSASGMTHWLQPNMRRHILATASTAFNCDSVSVEKQAFALSMSLPSAMASTVLLSMSTKSVMCYGLAKSFFVDTIVALVGTFRACPR